MQFILYLLQMLKCFYVFPNDVSERVSMKHLAYGIVMRFIDQSQIIELPYQK